MGRDGKETMSTTSFISFSVPHLHTFTKPSRNSIIHCSSSPSTSVIEDDGIVSKSEPDPVFPLSGCKACGKEEIESGCNGEGRIQGGIATVPGFGWWPIKAYRPCPEFVASGGRYMRQGQTLDEVAGFKTGMKAPPVKGNSDEPQPSKKKKGSKKAKK